MDAILILLRHVVVLPVLTGLGTGFLIWIWLASLAADALGVL